MHSLCQEIGQFLFMLCAAKGVEAHHLLVGNPPSARQPLAQRGVCSPHSPRNWCIDTLKTTASRKLRLCSWR
jgi:hypothetical protein